MHKREWQYAPHLNISVRPSAGMNRQIFAGHVEGFPALLALLLWVTHHVACFGKYHNMDRFPSGRQAHTFKFHSSSEARRLGVSDAQASVRTADLHSEKILREHNFTWLSTSPRADTLSYQLHHRRIGRLNHPTYPVLMATRTINPFMLASQPNHMSNPRVLF